MRSVQSKSEITADSKKKKNQQNLTNAETEVECVVIKTFGEKTVRQKSLAVDVQEMVSELSEAAKPWITSWVVLSNIKSSEREERQRLRAEEVVTSRDNAKLFNVDNNLELFKKVVKIIHRNRCITALRRKSSSSGTVTCVRPRSSMIQMRSNRSGRHVTKRECN